MVNKSAKFDEEAQDGLFSIVFTSFIPYISIVTLTFDLQKSIDLSSRHSEHVCQL